MKSDNLPEILKIGRECYQRLLSEAEVLLRNFECQGSDAIAEAINRRGQCIADILELEVMIKTFADAPRDDCRGGIALELDKYHAFKEEITRKIFELDSLVIAIAGERLIHLKDELSALARGKTVVSCYESGGRAFQRNLNETV